MIRIGVVGENVIEYKDLEKTLSNENFSIKLFNNNISELEFIKLQDVIIISNSNNAFFLAENAIKSGKHIFIENIANFSIAEISELLKICKEGNIKSAIYFKENNNPALDAIRKKINSPLFFECHRLRIFDGKKLTSDVVLELMLQDVFIVLGIVKSEIKKISATGLKVLSENIDISNARLEFTNGCIANFTVSSISLKEMSKMKIFQKDSYYSIDFLDQKTDLVSLTNNKKELTIKSNIYNKKNILFVEIEEFITNISSNKQSKVSLEDGFKALEVANKILKQINSFCED